MTKLSQISEISKDLLLFDVENLKNYIQDCVKDAVAQYHPNKSSDSENDWIGTAELSQLTGYTKQSIYQMAYYKTFPFPCHKLGKKLRFKKSEVLAFVEKKTQNYEFVNIIFLFYFNQP